MTTKKEPRAANTGHGGTGIDYLEDNQIITTNQAETHSQTAKAGKQRQPGSADPIQADKAAIQDSTFDDEFPDELIAIDHWSVHKDKKPINGNGEAVKKGDKIMHLSFKDAVIHMENHNGSGLAFDCKGTPYSYCDLDTYKDTADKDFHQHLVDIACNDTYVERSICGGTHIVHNGEALASAAAIDNRSNSLLYMTGDSSGLPKIGKLSQEFMDVSGFKPVSNVNTALNSIGDTNRGKRSLQECLKHFNNLTKDTTSGDFPSRSEFAFSLMNHARYAADNDVDMMVRLVDTKTESTGYEAKRLYGDALRCLKKTEDIDKTYFSTEKHNLKTYDSESATRAGMLLSSLRNGSDVEEKRVTWTWHPFFARNKFNMVGARGGSLKTSILTGTAAGISIGGRTPDGTSCFEKGHVLFVTTEDDPEDTLLPRFMAAGGDPSKITFLSSSEHHLDFDKHPEDLEIILENRPEIDFVILDPVTSMTGNTNTHMDSVVKRLAGIIAGITKKYGVCTVGVIHFRKGDPTETRNFVDMVTGSAGWVNSARVVSACFLDEDTNQGFFGVIKSNIGPKDYMFRYTPVIEKNVVKIEYSELEREHIAKVVYKKFNTKSSTCLQKQKEQDIEDACGLIEEFFDEHGPSPALVTDVEKYVKMHIGRAITYDNIKRAEKKIGYRKRSTGRGKPWKMHPPDCECEKC